MQQTLFRSATAAAAAAGALWLAAGPATAATAMSVTPSSGLSDGQSVTVSGTGYPAGSTVHVSECTTTDRCSNDSVPATAAADGTFSVTFTVRKTFEVYDWSTGSTVTEDCDVAQCNVSAWEEGTGTRSQTISFN